jgi:hypothetical protein
MAEVGANRNEDALVDVIRKWYATICYELALPLLPIRISDSQPTTVYGHDYVLGEYRPEDRSITMYVLPPNAPVTLRGSYLITLAHELRHAWQHRYNVAPTEGDADDWATKDFLRRYASGPTCGRYGGPIIGAARPCRSCGGPIRDGTHCGACQQAEIRRIVAEESRRRLLARRRLTDGMFAILSWPQRFIGEIRARRDAARREAVLEYKLQNIDSHPHNGTFGWWAIDGTYYVQTTSAGEAVMRVADDLSSETPHVEFFGDKAPFSLK